MGVFRVSIFLVAIVLGISQATPQGYSYLTKPDVFVDSSEHGQFPGLKSTTCKCGWTNKASSRIVGGRVTRVNEYPHMAGIIKSSNGRISLFCGASIITPYHAITAAHCTYDELYSSLYLLVGEHDITDEYETSQTKAYPIKQHIEHYGYNPRTIENDVAILVMAKKIEFNNYIGPICMPNRPMNSFLVDKAVKVTGWGRTSTGGSSATRLLKVNLRVIPLEECAPQYRYNYIDVDSPTQFCTYGTNKDACQGDSGGPVTWLDPETNRYVLVGLVSFGKDCATRVPGVNTDVYAFNSWIRSKIILTSPESVDTCTKLG